ncbi:DNA polymerase I [Haliangium sp. UPWRP_2]|uniref:DNA polymerase I n=1 Tax=Haliangium sp. UPWRP_2 TaxID=1931276 RepID=UPI000B547F53|nr:DNA polymerase I [Haliangium sp. UPWRP_2]PSM32125.1 DNA polymerase I [Haliangium sp. UPWRP_2]
MPSLYLVDGSNFLFRAFHAMPPMTTKSGIPTGAVRGFVSMLLRLIADELPSHLAVVFDAAGRSKRAELYPAYKANRSETPPELVPQFDLSRRMVRALGIPCLDATDVEADDIIASLAQAGRREGLPVVVVSSDKDLMQLVADGSVELLDTMKEEGRGKRFREKDVAEKFGVPPTQLGDVLSLMGDSSDNIPGVPGIGPKTAAQLIVHFGSLSALLNQLDTHGHLGEISLRGKDKVAAALREHRAQLAISRQLVALEDDLPLPMPLADLGRHPESVQRDVLLAMLTELEFNTLLKRVTTPGGLPGLPDLSAPSVLPPAPVPPPTTATKAATPTTPVAATPPPPTTTAAPMPPVESPALTESAAPSAAVELAAWIAATPGAPKVLLSHDALADWLRAAQPSLRQHGLAFRLMRCGEGDTPAKPPSPRVATLAGISLFTPLAPAAYLPLSHRYLGAPTQLSATEALSQLAPLLSDPTLRKFVYSAKDVLLLLSRYGQSEVAGIVADPALCSYLLDAGQDHSLDGLVEKHLPPDYPKLLSREALCRAGGKHGVPFDQVDIAAAADFAVAQARATYLLSALLWPRLDGAAQQLLSRLELPLARVLSVIEQHGILIDVDVLSRLGRETDSKLGALESEIATLAGARINLNSPKQLAELLFDKLGLEPVKKTRGKTGMSVDHEVLEALADQHPIAHKIIEYRSLSKLKGTYIDQLPELRDRRSGRIHTTFQQVVAATGRLSSIDPNLQNIPVRSGLGKEIRRAFIAPPGFRLIAADYSQIELRILAHLSRDPLLLESFQSGEDVHKRTAIEMFGPEAGATDDKRRAAKMINYGIIYGLSDYGLASRLSIERSVAKDYIREYFARYRGVQEFMNDLVAHARRDGGARTLLGRFRPLPDLTNRNFAVRAYAERVAKNTPLQGTAADIMKQAMIDVQTGLVAANNPQVRLLLTVHDELVLEAPEAVAEKVASDVQQAMEGAVKLAVPLKVDVGIAQSWADC